MSNDSITIEVFTDYVCPWCYLSTAAISELERQYPVNIEWLPFPLNPSTPPQGLLLSELFNGRDMSTAQAQLEQRMHQAGLDYKRSDYTWNTRQAQELGKWANGQPGGKAIHLALYRAYFVENRKLSDREVLLDVAVNTGLDHDLAADVLDSRSYSEAVDADWARARKFGITGVPCFVSGGFMLGGAQPFSELERFYQYVESRANMA